MDNLILRELGPGDEEAFMRGLRLWDGEDLTWYTFEWKAGISFPEMLERLRKNREGLDLPENRVASSMYYAFLSGEIVGRVNVRHQLNENLRRRGGHVGYAVAPGYRRRGLATEMMKQVLPLCRGLGIASLMVSCADDNTGSWKLIEKLGGRLEDKVWDDEDQEMIRRYWVTP